MFAEQDREELALEGYLWVARVTDIPPGQRKLVNANDEEVLVLNVDGKFYAIGSKCTHLGYSLLEGPVEGMVITCPNHKAKFDITTGKVLSLPAKVSLPTYEVKVQGEDIYLKAP